ncbi:MAG: hypothetical protein SGJ27_08375 [Candidatus Melainabacteria bacterium]|nr:hypothetical protein [Candidatus Melainabacteria bacterium]
MILKAPNREMIGRPIDEPLAQDHCNSAAGPFRISPGDIKTPPKADGD